MPQLNAVAHLPPPPLPPQPRMMFTLQPELSRLELEEDFKLEVPGIEAR
jgi:hypothetical protein